MPRCALCKAFLILGFAKVRVQTNAVTPREFCALLHQICCHGKRRAGREHYLSHGKIGRVVIPFDGVSAVAQNFVRRLYNGIRRQSPVFSRKAHAAARTHHANAEVFGGGKLRCE
jgi:predicted RNA binding protein YcfA (HicA-like mRNA interferase family)